MAKRSRWTPSEDTEVIDCQGKYIIPGLIDSHIHLEPWSLSYLLSFGVTTVRDCGNLIPVMKYFVEKISRGEIKGPRIVWGSPPLESLTKESEEKDPWKIRNPDQAKEVAQKLIAQGVQHIKVYNRIKSDDLKAIIEVSNQNRIPVIGHVRDIGATRAAELGIRSIEHGIGIPEDCRKVPFKLLPDYNDDDLSQRFRYRQFVAWKDIDDLKARAVMKVLKAHHVFVVSTLVSDCVRRPEERRAELQLIWDPLPKMFQNYSLSSGIGKDWSDADYQNFKASFVREKRWFRDFVKMGGKAAAGTDSPVPFAVPGFSLHEELQLLSSSGLSPLEVLRTATSNAAELLGISNEVGSIKEGQRADLIILSADPLADIRNTLHLEKVIKSGTVYEPIGSLSPGLHPISRTRARS